jgi:hypothetical protein
VYAHRITRTALAAGLLVAPAAEAKAKLRAAERALDREAEQAQDGNDAAVSQLAAVRRNLASAQKTTLRERSPQTAGAVARTQGTWSPGPPRSWLRSTRSRTRRRTRACCCWSPPTRAAAQHGRACIESWWPGHAGQR